MNKVGIIHICLNHLFATINSLLKLFYILKAYIIDSISLFSSDVLIENQTSRSPYAVPRELKRIVFPLSLYFNSSMTQYYRQIHVVLLVIA